MTDGRWNELFHIAVADQAYDDTYAAIGLSFVESDEIQMNPENLETAFVKLARERGLVTEETS